MVALDSLAFLLLSTALGGLELLVYEALLEALSYTSSYTNSLPPQARHSKANSLETESFGLKLHELLKASYTMPQARHTPQAIHSKANAVETESCIL